MLSENAKDLAKAMALQWGLTSKKLSFEVMNLMAEKGLVHGPVKRLQSDAAWSELQNEGLLVHDGASGYAKIGGRLGNDLYFELIDSVPHSRLSDILTTAQYRVYSMDWFLEVGRMRLSAMQDPRQAATRQYYSRRVVESEHFWDALIDRADPRLLQHLAPQWRDWVANLALTSYLGELDEEVLVLVDALLDEHPLNDEIQFALAQVLFLRGDDERARTYLGDSAGRYAPFLDALTQIRDGEFGRGAHTFSAALTSYTKSTRSRLAPLYPATQFWYPMALMASGNASDLDRALKFCVTSSRSKNPSRYNLFGKWVYAIRVRLGQERFDPNIFFQPHAFGLEALFDLLLINWLAPEFEANAITDMDLTSVHRRSAMTFSACGFVTLAELADRALAHAMGAESTAPFFVGSQLPRWQLVLDSLRLLGGDAEERESRYVWVIETTELNNLRSITPFLQVKGVRGWGKPKAVSLAKLMADNDLPGEDARVLRSNHKVAGGRGGYELDLGAAMMSLVGHPRVALSTDLDRFIEVVERRPEVVVSRGTDGFEVGIEPASLADLVDETNARSWGRVGDGQLLWMMFEPPTRLVVIRLTKAQRQAIALVGKRLALPREAVEAIDGTLAALSAHFEIQSDDVVAGRLVDAVSKLRCQLKPWDEGLTLRLVSAPLGPDGPRFVPGVGRANVVARINAETVATTRDLDWEADLAVRVLEALGVGYEDPASEIEFETADEALEALEALNAFLDELELDWPKGKAVRVLSPGLGALRVTIASQRDWLAVKGGVELDDDKVIALKELIAAANRGAKFVTLKEGQYLALTGSLRERVLELAALTDDSGKEIKASKLAIGPLMAVTEGTQATFDLTSRQLIERLERSQQLEVPVPPTLEAELRPYQLDGFTWAMRLAEADLGACLADDMGLGKTIQALAVALARSGADLAPTLVICPTSVVDNWIKETLRFAPTLNPVNYSRADRARVVTEANGRDLLVVSYSVLIQDEEILASRVWRTLIVDEAQAIKNLAAKRTKALAGLSAEFKMALSGTPIENHLTELYSILNFLNPGLLGSPAQFNRRFVTPVERDKDQQARRRLRRIVAPFVLRRLKTDVLSDLPPRTELTLVVEPRQEERYFYEALRQQALEAAELAVAQDEAQASFHILAELTRLRRGACDARLIEPRFGATGSKIEALLDLATDIGENGHQALVFSQFVDFLTLVREAFDAAKIRYQYLDGSTPAPQRAKEVEAFQNGASNFFLISIKAGGVGLNLTAADYVIITDPWWNPAVEEQAMGRAHRIGQSRPVTSYRLIAQSTIEETITELHASKLALAEGVLGDDGSINTLPSARELVELLRYQ